MAEFKKLSEVELMTTSSDNTTILVEDGGEIKRMPKSEVDGGTSGYVVTLTENNFDGEMMCSDNYDEMYDVLVAGGMVWIDPSKLQGFPIRELVVSWGLNADGLFVFGTTMNEPLLFPNGSHNLIGEK